MDGSGYRIDDALGGAVVEQGERHLVEGGVDRGGLAEAIDDVWFGRPPRSARWVT
jgi:hypothetical protein